MEELNETAAESSEIAATAECAELQTVGGAPEAKKSAKEAFKGYFTATRIAYMAIFTAISYAIGLLDFSLMPGTPVSFLKLDFSNVFVMVGGFALGPVAGVVIAVLKELLHAITVGQTAFIGELANVLMVVPYMLIPALVYKKHKGIKTVIWTLAVGCLAQCAVSLPVNYLLTFPAFMWGVLGRTWEAGHELFIELWYWTLLFNFVKSLIISVVVFILYKPLSNLIKFTNAKVNGLKGRKKV